MQTVRPMTERPNRRSRKSQPPLGDLAVKGAVRQRGTSVYRGAWSTPPVLGTGNRWFESSYADEIKQEERFENSAFGARPVWLQRGIKRLNVPTNLEQSGRSIKWSMCFGCLAPLREDGP